MLGDGCAQALNRFDHHRGLHLAPVVEMGHDLSMAAGLDQRTDQPEQVIAITSLTKRRGPSMSAAPGRVEIQGLAEGEQPTRLLI
jgi:hypothetical protein